MQQSFRRSVTIQWVLSLWQSCINQKVNICIRCCNPIMERKRKAAFRPSQINYISILSGTFQSFFFIIVLCIPFLCFEHFHYLLLSFTIRTNIMQSLNIRGALLHEIPALEKQFLAVWIWSLGFSGIKFRLFNALILYSHQWQMCKNIWTQLILMIRRIIYPLHTLLIRREIFFVLLLFGQEHC